MDYREALHIWRKWVAKRPALVRLTAKFRNQANKILAYSMVTSHDPAENGEALLIRQIAGELQTIVDVGANKGEWALMVKNYVPSGAKFHLIEPGLEAVDRLQPLISEQVSVYHLGMSDISGEQDFYEETNAGEQSSFVVTAYHQTYKTFTVPVQRLDCFCRKNDIPAIDFLKIDCEGYDYKVLLEPWNFSVKETYGISNLNTGKAGKQLALL